MSETKAPFALRRPLPHGWSASCEYGTLGMPGWWAITLYGPDQRERARVLQDAPPNQAQLETLARMYGATLASCAAEGAADDAPPPEA